MGEPTPQAELVICSKSEWEPAIRREHALAAMAAENGHPVCFVEASHDVRGVRERPREWARQLLRAGVASPRPGVVTIQRSSLIPGHRGQAWQQLDNRLLTRTIAHRPTAYPAPATVCLRPWDWPAVARSRAARRVLDLTDDWGALMPGHGHMLTRMYAQAAEQADEIIVVNGVLAELFPDRTVNVIPNGVADMMLARAPRPSEPRRLVYVGTLTERFDAPLMHKVMTVLSDWRLDIVGACMYAGLDGRPAPELERLLELVPRVRWHGQLAREQMIDVLDAASVAVIPNRAKRARGQDSMKVYDYSARARPIVASRDQDIARTAPHVIQAAGCEEFVAAVKTAEREAAARGVLARRWALDNGWAARWPRWSAAVFGD